MSSDLGIEAAALAVDRTSGRFRLTAPDGSESLWGWGSFGPKRLPDRLLRFFKDTDDSVTPALPHLPEAEAQLLFAGDLLFQDDLLHADAEELFSALKPLFREADLLCGNLEGPLVPGHFSGRFPLYRIPDSRAADLAEAGFDLLQCANNHLLDAGTDGLSHTFESLTAAGITPLGLRLAEGEPSWILAEINGIRIGLCAYTYENPPLGAQALASLNGHAISPAWRGRIDSFSYLGADASGWAESCRRLTERAESLRAAGAELLIFCLHWGTEYKAEPDAKQEELASMLADAGVDLIIGSHPHVPQPLRLLPSRVNPRGCICYYSLGDLLSARHTAGSAPTGQSDTSPLPTEGGILARVRIVREGGDVYVASAEALPVATVRLLSLSDAGQKPRYSVLPLISASEDLLKQIFKEYRLSGFASPAASLEWLLNLEEKLIQLTK